MKTNIFLILLIPTLFYSCCKNNNYHYISDSNHPVYQVGNLLIYKSDQNYLDTFKVLEVSSNFRFLSYEGYCKEKGDYYENIQVVFSNKVDSVNNLGWIKHSYYVIDASDNYMTEIDWIDNKFEGFVYSGAVTSMLINSKTYTNVYMFTKDTTIITSNKMYKLYLSKKYGVIRYEFKNGTYWELQ
jgi:hypothetical protein